MKGKRLIQMMKDISPEFEDLYYRRSLQDSLTYKLTKEVKGEPVKMDGKGLALMQNVLSGAIVDWGRKNGQYED